MPSLKRPRSQTQSSKTGQMLTSTTSQVLVSVCLCLQLISAPSVTNAFSVSGASSITSSNSVTAVFSPLFATSSTEISIRNKSTNKAKVATKSKEANLELFKTYNEYKRIQERLSELRVSKSPISEQSAELNLSPATLETILVNGYNARQTLLLDNIPLVHFAVKKLAKNQLNSLSREDLIQEGTIGLIKAIDKFLYLINITFVFTFNMITS